MKYKLREVVIELTKRCNLRCVHCGSDCTNGKYANELTFEQWRNIMYQLRYMKVEKIVFSGGEPTIRDDFGGLLLLTSMFNMKVGFISNGLEKFSDLLLNRIVESKPFTVGLSLDGLKETHNNIRRNRKSWNGVLKNISLLQENSIPICIVTTVNKLNYSELPKLASFLKMSEINSWQIQIAMPAGRMLKSSIGTISPPEFRQVCKQILTMQKTQAGLKIEAADCFGPAPLNMIRSVDFGGCSAGISSMSIDATGRIIPCLSMQGIGASESCLKRPISEIWEKSSIFDFNRKFDSTKVLGKCQKCSYLASCRGGCNSMSNFFFNHFHESPFCFIREFSPKEENR